MQIAKLVWSAIENKYNEATYEEVEALVALTLEKLERTESEQQVLENCTPTRNFETDLINQVQCFYLIETYWCHIKPRPFLIENIHAAVYGRKISDIKYRTTDFVEDFGGRVPEEKEHIKPSLQRLNKRLCEFFDLEQLALERQALYMSDIFSNIIRLHPFEDGNGRTARMTIQYCLRHWGYDYLIVPKIRNDNEWKNALFNGIEGDYDAMQSFFKKRMVKRH